jgi:hypothetical protein
MKKSLTLRYWVLGKIFLIRLLALVCLHMVCCITQRPPPRAAGNNGNEETMLKKNHMLRRTVLLGLAAVMALGLAAAACSSNGGAGQPARDPAEAVAAGDLTTEGWRAADNTITTWFTEGQSDENSGFNADTTTLRIGETADGKAIVSLLRLPLEATWMAGEVGGARLFLKVAEGEAPDSVYVCPVVQPWDGFDPADILAAAIDKSASEKLAVKAESSGWISIPVTEYVKNWMNGDAPNYGLAVFGAGDGEEVAVASGYTENADDCPYLEVSGAVGQRATTYGKFAYTEAPPPGAEAGGGEGGGNCLSYALRDTDMILLGDLDADFDEMGQIYAQSGEDAIADYIARSVERYVAANGEGLRVSRFREIDDFDSEIDGQTEYRIALRVGCKPIDGVVDFEEHGAFDYHFWAQCDDGRWAQKFPQDVSQIIPYSAPGLSPGKYGWDSALQWLSKFRNFYTSKVIYFAVTKDVDEFTRHNPASSEN